jgi:hypothetical protein
LQLHQVGYYNVKQLIDLEIGNRYDYDIKRGKTHLICSCAAPVVLLLFKKKLSSKKRELL